MKRISIITINYNNSAGLERTLKSIASQTSKDFECIVVDGASTDDSICTVEKYNQIIDRFVSEPDGGIYNAMNKGVRMSTCEYCLFINSGDCLARKTSIEEALQCKLETPIISFDTISIGRTSRYCKAVDTVTCEYMLVYSLSHPSTLIMRDLLLENPYSEKYKIISDWSFFFEEIVIRNTAYKSIHIPLALFYEDGISSKNSDVSLTERKDFLLTYFPSKFINEFYSNNYFNIGNRVYSNMSTLNKLIVSSYCIFVYVMNKTLYMPIYSLVKMWMMCLRKN